MDRSTDGENPLAKLPKWAQWIVFFVLFSAAFGGCQYYKHVTGDGPEARQIKKPLLPIANQKSDFTLDAAPGTEMSGAMELFRTLVGHCPGLYKFKEDLAHIKYEPQKTFLIRVSERPAVIPTEYRAMGHTCHFSVSPEKAEVAKRPCARLCTGEPMPDVDGDTHSYVNGKMMPWETLRRAISGTKNDMADVHGENMSRGAARLAIWGAENLRWTELQEIPETKYGLVMKDSDANRGKRLCVKGDIIEIAIDRSVPGHQIFQGGMYSGSGNIYRFIAVHSTGEIIEGSRARFCGIVTGQHHYENSLGGVARAVQLVGMFDLPENRE